MKKLVIEDIFNSNTLNIFTDSSVKGFGDYFISCPGAIAVTTFNGIPYISDQRAYISYDSTNNAGEIQAVRMGVYLANINKHRYKVINLFSDSNTCISGINSWLDSWIMNARNGVFVTNSKKVVDNQETFKNIIDDIITNNIRINFYHQKGHVNIKKDKDFKLKDKTSLNYAMNTFKVINNLNPSIDLMKLLSYYNDKVDVLTKNYLEHIDRKKIGIKTSSYVFRDRYNNPEGLEKFRKLINQEKKG